VSLLSEIGGAFEPLLKAGKSKKKNTTEGSLVGPAEKQKAMEEDPLEAVMWEHYDDATSGIGLDYITRESMASAPQIAPIISTRIRQVRKFAQRPHGRFGLGFEVGLRDSSRAPTRADRKKIEEMTQLVETCGYIDPNDKDAMFQRDMFPTFLCKYARDSLVHDQRNAEFMLDRLGRPSRWVAVDCKTIRRALPKSRKHTKDGRVVVIPPDYPFVQSIKGVVHAHFDYRRLSFGIRRPVTDIRRRGYGFAEMDELVTVVTALLWSLDYNANYFRQGTTAKGILNIVGSMPKDQLRSFRRMWAQLMSGVNNAWRTPIVNTPSAGGDVKWIPLHQSNRDMEWSRFSDWLMWMSAAAFGMSLEEVGGRSPGGAAGNKAMFESDNEAKVRASQERGLDPLLKGIAEDLNKHFIWSLAPELSLRFVGLDQKGEQTRLTLDKQRLSWMFVNEIRAEYDLEPVPDEENIMDNQIWWQAKSQAAMMAQQGGEEGEEEGGEEGEEGAAAEGEGGEAEEQEAAEAPFGAMMWGGEDAEDAGEATEKGLRRVPYAWSLSGGR